MGCGHKSQRGQNWAIIIASDEGLVTCVRFALAVRFRTWCLRPTASALDFLAGAWAHLLLSIFLAGVSNSRIDWAARNSPGRRISAGISRTVRPCGVLACADAALDFEWIPHGHGDLLGGHDRIGAAGPEFLAARHAGGLFRVLPLVRQCGAGFFRL